MGAGILALLLIGFKRTANKPCNTKNGVLQWRVFAGMQYMRQEFSQPIPYFICLYAPFLYLLDLSNLKGNKQRTALIVEQAEKKDLLNCASKQSLKPGMDFVRVGRTA